jgi:alpha-tubulin suppressor-like RCC1 family protein
LAGGFFHSIALTADGRVVGWGQNGQGQTNIPPTVTNIVAIAAGAYHNLAVTLEGRVIAWGLGSSGETNVPPGLSNVVQVAGGETHSLALQADGTIHAWGTFEPPAIPIVLSNCVGIAAGWAHSVGITADGRAIPWGNASYTNTPAGLSNVVAVTAGRDATVALTAEGKVVGWARTGSAMNPIETTFTNALQISMQRLWCVALQRDGKVMAWGTVLEFNDYGQTNPPSGLSNVVLVAAGRYHGMALIDNENPALSWSLRPPALTTNGAALEVPTQRGRLYIVERSDGLHPTAWSVHTRLAGNGSVQTIPMATNTANAYRVRRLP